MKSLYKASENRIQDSPRPAFEAAAPTSAAVKSFWQVKAMPCEAPAPKPYEYSSFELVRRQPEKAPLPEAKGDITPVPVADMLETYQTEAEAYMERARELARQEAERVLHEAYAEADSVRSEAETAGFKAGFKAGYDDGRQNAEQECREQLQQRVTAALEELALVAQRAEEEKQRQLEENLTSLRDLTIAIAEKVIEVNLKSSADSIERMILAATERSKNHAWAKIYVSEYDAQALISGDSGIIEAMQGIAPNVKIVAMENGERGDCIIEFPDQIIDAGVKTQLGNIKEILQAGENG